MPIISAIVSAATAAYTAVSAAFAAGGIFASGTALGFVARAALSIGLSMGLNAFAGQNNRKRGAQAEPAANNQTLQIGGNIPRQVAFGKVGTKGQLSHVWAHGPGNAYLTQIFVLSDGRIGGLTGVWLGDKKLTLRALEPTHNEHQRFDTVEHDAPHLEIRVFDGRDGQLGAHSYLYSVASVGSPGEADALYEPDRGAGVAYVVVTIWQYNNRWSGIPDWTWEIDGYRCYDPRFDTTAGGSGPMRWEDRETWTTSSNPAVQIYNYLRGIVAEGEVVMGMEVPVFDLQHDLFRQAASICDETVTLLEGGTEARYVSSLIVTADEGEHRNAIAPLVQAMAGYLVEKVGQFGVIAGAAQVPVVSITDQDLVWTRGARYSGKLSRQSRANEVHGQFVDTSAAWQPNSYAPVKDAGAAANDGERLAQQLDLPAVPSPTQAFRIAKARLRESRRQASADIEVGYHLLWLEIGDWIIYASEKYGFTKTFRIVGWGRNADDSTALSLREVGNEIYSHTAADEEPYQSPGTTPGEPALLSTPQAFTVQADVAPDTSRPIVICSWTPITDTRVIAMIIEYRQVGTLNATRLRDDTPLDGRYVIDQPAVGVEYEYRAQLRTEPPRPVFWTNWVRIAAIPDPIVELEELFALARAAIAAIAAIGEGSIRDTIKKLNDQVERLAADAATEAGNAYEKRELIKVQLEGAFNQAFAAIEEERITRVSETEALASITTALASQLTDVETGLTGAAAALTSLTTTVNIQGETLTSQSAALTSLGSRLTDAEGNISGTATAVSGLTTTVSSQGGAITSIASSLTALNTAVDGNSATLTTYGESIDGISLQYGITGSINGVTGGFRFSGARRLDGVVSYAVEIVGNLVVDGTISGQKLQTSNIISTSAQIGNLVVDNISIKNGAISNSAAVATGGTSATTAIAVRSGARVSCVGMFYGAAGAYWPFSFAAGAVQIFRDGSLIQAVGTSYEASGTGSSAGVAYLATPIMCLDYPPEGTSFYTIVTTNAVGVGGLTLVVEELSK
jgi:hypothetical protein